MKNGWMHRSPNWKRKPVAAKRRFRKSARSIQRRSKNIAGRPTGMTSCFRNRRTWRKQRRRCGRLSRILTGRWRKNSKKGLPRSMRTFPIFLSGCLAAAAQCWNFPKPTASWNPAWRYSSSHPENVARIWRCYQAANGRLPLFQSCFLSWPIGPRRSA